MLYYENLICNFFMELSTKDFAFIVYTEAVKECLWLRGFTMQLGIIFDDVIDCIM